MLTKTKKYLLLFCSTTVFLANAIDEEELRLKVRAQISNAIKQGEKEEVSVSLVERIKAKLRAEKYAEHIKKTAKKEARRQVFREEKNDKRSRIYKKNKGINNLLDKDFFYKVPEWSFKTQPFMQKNSFQLDIKFDFVNQAFYSGGESQDLSNLIFRQSDLTLKDILLASRLMKEDLVAWAVNTTTGVPDTQYNKLHYLYILADQPIIFDASYSKQIVDFNFARHFNDGGISLGFMLPILRRNNKIKLTSQISSADRESLRKAIYTPTDICGPTAPKPPDFLDKYDTLENFLEDILDKKGMSFNKNDQAFGFGDLFLFFNYEIEWKEVERFFVGLNLVLPTANGADTSKLWGPDLGNGGFYFVEPHLSLLFSENRYFNPHIFLNAKIGLPAKVDKRVPKFVSYDGIDPSQGRKATDLMIFGNEVYLLGADGVFTNELDAYSRGFADEAQKINIIPGPKIFMRVGNIVENFFSKYGFFDLFYDFGAKWKDYTRGWLNSDEYDSSYITDNSWYYEHRVGLSYSHQVDRFFRFNVGFLYTFAGENVEELFRLNLGINIKF
jgi:hypothetical protein